MKKQLILHFIANVVSIVVAGFVTSAINEQLGLVFGLLSGAYLHPQIIKLVEKKGLVK